MKEKKRVVIAGCRDYTNYKEAECFVDICLRDISKEYDIVIVSGGARGADSLGERYAKERGLELECYPAHWKLLGKRAGIVRNKQMAEIGDFVICFWDGESKGTKTMIEFAQELQKPLKIKMR